MLGYPCKPARIGPYGQGPFVLLSQTKGLWVAAVGRPRIIRCKDFRRGFPLHLYLFDDRPDPLPY